MTHLDKSLQQRVDDFCKSHEAEFAIEFNDYIRRYLLKSKATWFVAGMMLFSGFLNAYKIQEWVMIFNHMPVFILFASYAFLAKRFPTVNGNAAIFVDVLNKLMTVESAWAFYLYHQAGSLNLIAASAPLLMMVIIWALNTHFGIITGIIHSLISTAILLGTVLVLDSEYLLVNTGAFAIGAAMGAILRSLVIKTMRYKFYFSQQEKNLRNHAYRQLEKMLYPHQRHMIEDGYTLEETMPVGWGEACVIAFDVVESTKIKSPYARTLLQNVLKKCQTLMMQNYSSSEFESNAYRIKEMGDGFLCSIGFPFKVPGAWQKESLAIKLAQQFIQVFHEEAAKLAPHEKVFCAVGIASGVIEAFYPHTTPKEYDIYGRPLILATRYESIRKELFNHIPKTSLIVLQEPVYLRLPPQLQQGFVQFELKNFRIRDDQEAKRLFYQVFDQRGHQYVRPPNLTGKVS